jgi:hypothetical protein
LLGKEPSLLKSLSISKDYRPLLEDVTTIASQNRLQGDHKHTEYIRAIDSMFLNMMHLIVKRIQKQKNGISKEQIPLCMEDFIRQFEVPSYLRSGQRINRNGILHRSCSMDGSVSFPCFAGLCWRVLQERE